MVIRSAVPTNCRETFEHLGRIAHGQHYERGINDSTKEKDLHTSLRGFAEGTSPQTVAFLREMLAHHFGDFFADYRFDMIVFIRVVASCLAQVEHTDYLHFDEVFVRQRVCCGVLVAFTPRTFYVTPGSHIPGMSPGDLQEIAIDMQPGDLIVCRGDTQHRGGPNHTSLATYGMHGYADAPGCTRLINEVSVQLRYPRHPRIGGS